MRKPKGVFNEFGGLSVSLSSTTLQGLIDAIEYVIYYPFQCTEQLSSRLLTLISTKDILKSFNSPKLSFNEEEIMKKIGEILELIQKKTSEKWEDLVGGIINYRLLFLLY